MAKKGQAAQLQIEVNNDEEWEKLLQKEGLIVVDVYSDWCGPCLGMQANLKKIKMEYGGDILILAIAKSDGITALERFRNRSEPTWMFISNGKMIALMFGASAPQLRNLIIEELKKEKDQKEGQPIERLCLEVTDLSEEEKIRYEAIESKEREMKEKEERKRAKETLDRRTKECENILSNLSNFGVLLIFPSAKDSFKSILNETLDEAGLVINQTEKITFNEDMINDLCYFTEVSEEFSEESLEELLSNESIMILVKISTRSEITDIDDGIVKMIYGSTRGPPGAPNSFAHKLMTEIEATIETAKKDNIAVWAPRTAQVRATAMRMFFPKISSDYTIPEPPPEPEHLAIIFPWNKKDKVLNVMEQFPNEVMKYGMFTKIDPDDTQLVAKSFRKMEKIDAKHRTYEEKLVFQVSKQKSEFILMLVQLDPLYMSPNAKEGKLECLKFFPDDYVPEAEEEEEVVVEDEEEPTEDEEFSEGEGGTSSRPKLGEEGEETEGETTEEGEGAEITPSGEKVTPSGEIIPSASAGGVEAQEMSKPSVVEG